MREFLAVLYDLHLLRVPGAWRAREAWQRRARPLVPQALYERGRKLNLGCSVRPLPGWTNVDVRLEVRPDVACTVDALPFAAAGPAFDLVRASHVLEHFPPDAIQAVLREWIRVLKPGGLLVVCVPNYLRQCWRAILKPAAFDPFSPEGREKTPLWTSAVFALDLPESFRHKALFTRAALRHHLEAAGLEFVGFQTFQVEQPYRLGIEDDSCSPFSLNAVARKS